KSVAELEYALDYGVGRIFVDSLDEIDRLDTIAGARGVLAPVMLRVTVGVEAHTHDFIATAHEDQKFGLSLADGTAARAAQKVADSAHLRLDGLHSHIGSQIFDISGFQVAAARCWASAPRSWPNTASICPRSTSAAASASATPHRTHPSRLLRWRRSWPRSWPRSAAVWERTSRRSRSSPVAPSSPRRCSPSTRSEPSNR